MNLVSAVTDAKLLPALREARGKGIALELMGTLPAEVAARTAEEKLMGTCWACGGAAELETPPRLYALVNAAWGTRGFWLGPPCQHNGDTFRSLIRQQGGKDSPHEQPESI